MDSPLSAMKKLAIIASIFYTSSVFPMMMTTTLNIIHSTEANNNEVVVFRFNCLCNPDSFWAKDLRARCLDDLLSNLSGSADDALVGGDFNLTLPCFGWPMYGHRWVDMAKPAAADCLQQARDAIQQCCKHRKGADVSTGDTCRMRFELYPFWHV
ncbi:unnamed protein product [Linum trigynum]|uniref:Gnk2-homologous domain-containing protein n=1 Tax=Linum trigynum TaxID=586398 RepID=A0AAV2DWA2_9ROSI